MEQDNEKVTGMEEGKKKRGRPRKEEVGKSDLIRPQTINFIADVLKKDRRTVALKMKGVYPVSNNGTSDLYDFSEACEAIFEKNSITAKDLYKMNTNQLPPSTQSAFWTAQKQRMSVYEEASRLYHVNHVLFALDSLIKVFRESILSIPHKIEDSKKNGKTHKQMSNEILEAVIEESKKTLRTLSIRSFSGDIEEWETEVDGKIDDYDEGFDDE